MKVMGTTADCVAFHVGRSTGSHAESMNAVSRNAFREKPVARSQDSARHRMVGWIANVVMMSRGQP